MKRDLKQQIRRKTCLLFLRFTAKTYSLGRGKLRVLRTSENIKNFVQK